MTRTPLAVANWKMNTDLEQAQVLAASAAEYSAAQPAAVEIVLCPPFPWIVPVANALAGSPVATGAQDCWPEPNGAFTGDISAEMLAPWCAFVIVGHSERRSIHEEMDNLIARKLRAALDNGLHPILCVGETLAQRNAGNATTIVSRQLNAAFSGLPAEAIGRCTVAYEPVWAIGTGRSATADDAQQMCHHIRGLLAKIDAGIAARTRVLYGGSVNPDNAAEIAANEDIDGALVGGASLKADAFNRICDAIAAKSPAI